MKPLMKKQQSTLGFTLIELLLAISLLAILVSFYGGMITHSVRLKEKILSEVRHFETMQGLLQRLEFDIAGAYLEPITDKHEVTHTGFFLENNTESGAEVDILAFTTHANTVIFLEGQDHNEFAHSEIGYEFVLDDESELFKMYRREDATMDLEVKEGGVRYLLAEGLRGFNVQVYNSKDKSWAESWNSNDAGNLLPDAVEVTIWYGGTEEQDSWKPLSKLIRLEHVGGGDFRRGKRGASAVTLPTGQE